MATDSKNIDVSVFGTREARNRTQTLREDVFSEFSKIPNFPKSTYGGGNHGNLARLFTVFYSHLTGDDASTACRLVFTFFLWKSIVFEYSGKF